LWEEETGLKAPLALFSERLLTGALLGPEQVLSRPFLSSTRTMTLVAAAPYRERREEKAARKVLFWS